MYRDLRLVHECLERHVASAEGTEGLLAEMDRSQPILARRIDRLRREHGNLLDRVGDLRWRVEQLWCCEWAIGGADAQVATADIRRHAAQLLEALRHHQADEADLIFEAFYTDIGAGD